MKTPDRIFFDLDDTILVFDRACDEAWDIVIEEFSAAACIPATQLRNAIFTTRDEFWSDPENFRTGRLALRETRRHVTKLALRKLEGFSDDTAEALADVYTDLQFEKMRPFPGAVETLDRLKATGIPLGLITNGQRETQRAKIERFKLGKYFDIILIEGEQGIGKPDIEIYERALALSGSSPETSVMIGDNLAWDVIAPMQAGMRGVWHNYSEKPLPDGCTPHAIVNDMEKAFDVLVN